MNKSLFVEIVGAPGSGKTTLSRQIQQSSGLGAIGCREALYRLLLANKKILGPTALSLLSMTRGWKKFELPSIPKSWMPPTALESRKYDNFANLVLKIASEGNNGLAGLRACDWAERALLERLLIKSHGDVADFVLCDEPVSFRLSLLNSGSDALRKEYWETMPAPDALIILTPSLATLEERNVRRATRELPLSMRECSSTDRRKLLIQASQLVDDVLTFLPSRGIPLLVLDESADTDSMLAKSEHFLAAARERNTAFGATRY